MLLNIEESIRQVEVVEIVQFFGSSGAVSHIRASENAVHAHRQVFLAALSDLPLWRPHLRFGMPAAPHSGRPSHIELG
jgi:hypothetical protein